MDQYIRENEAYFAKQKSSFKFSLPKEKDVQASASDTTIATRIRPLLPDEIDTGEIDAASVDVELNCAAIHELRQKFNNQPALNSTTFRVDRVYGPEQDSNQIYEDLVKPLVPWAWSGGVSTLFAYGQTGSGKTYSVNQLEELVAKDLMDGCLEGNRDVYICVFELIGNQAFDLLNDRRSIRVMEDSFGESQLVGALEHKPATATELLALISQSMSFRKTSPTLKNDTSSRSHAVCRIRITNKDLPESPDGLLFLIDLAGSEMATDIKEHSTDRMKETREINKSLSTLKDCIRGRAVWNLSESSGNWKAPKVHIPFRSSVLTKVLKHVFDVKSDRYCKTAILACVKPNASDAPASKNTLRYAELLRVPGPPNKPVIFNPRVPSTWKNSELQAWITSNSGEPPISPTILAPTETGSQLLKLPKAEFVTRCLKTENVLPERARAFYDKFWRLHVDSRSSSKSENLAADSALVKDAPATPFQTRLRPGMIVRCKQWHPVHPIRHVCLLAPVGAFGAGVGSVGGPPGYRNSRDEGEWKAEGDKYICAEVHPAIMPEAYMLALEMQSLIAVGEMEDEVLMEFDDATRMYFMTI